MIHTFALVYAQAGKNAGNVSDSSNEDHRSCDDGSNEYIKDHDMILTI